MFLAACLFACCLPAQPNPLPGSWWLNGNNHYGNLVINLVANGIIDGTMYDQPIRGSFDAKSNKVVLNRLEVRRDGSHHVVQVYTGTLSRVEKVKPPHYALEGTFKAIGGPKWGEADKEYPWKATALRLPSPAVDFQEMQGQWEATGDRFLAKLLQLPDAPEGTVGGLALSIRGNQIFVGREAVAAFANDLPSKSLGIQVGYAHHRLLMLTLPNGKAVLCSYAVTENGLDIAYPHTTSCSRSGQTAHLKRPAK